MTHVGPPELVTGLRHLVIRWERVRDEVAHAHGVRGPDTRLLVMLAEGGGALRPIELADRLEVSSGTLTAVVDRLEAGGLVERRPHPSDRRGFVISLTDAGAGLGFELNSRLVAAIGSVVPARHYTEVCDAIARVTELMTAAAPDGSATTTAQGLAEESAVVRVS